MLRARVRKSFIHSHRRLNQIQFDTFRLTQINSIKTNSAAASVLHCDFLRDSRLFPAEAGEVGV